MSGLLRAEVLKLRTASTTLGLSGGMLGLVCLVVLVHGLALPEDRTSYRDQLHVFSWGGIGVIFAALLGAISITGELRSGTIRPTFLATPRRGRVLSAKLIVAAAAGAVGGAAATALTLVLGSVILAARGIAISLDAGDFAQLLAGWTLAAGLWAAIGLGLGAIVRSQVAVIIALSAWLLFVEHLLLAQLPDVVRFFPGSVAAAMSGTTITGDFPGEPGLLPSALGGLLLGTYALTTALFGMIAVGRRDVP